ncbi:unnamed protein product [Leptidea sinapis]|uniref:Uncharacterized protein n=1 Tax=Leptidea sinapis TaxID=189913 RepID=A0A5E4Q7V9_9NEOP|nr:unnamed protein product [Leptidea sinapis]
MSVVAVLEACLNQTIHHEYGVQIKVTNVYYCHSSDITTEVEVDVDDWLFGGAVFLIILLNAFGTFYDFNLQSKTKAIGNPYILSFSIFQSWNRLTVSEHKDSRFTKFKAVHAIRRLIDRSSKLYTAVWPSYNYTS